MSEQECWGRVIRGGRVCEKCGERGLAWARVEDGHWSLVDENNEIHNCKERHVRNGNEGRDIHDR